MKCSVILPRHGARALLSFSLLMWAATQEARAVFRAWQGTSGVAWSTPANWLPAGAPLPGDSLHFPSTTPVANRIASNDIPDIVLASMLFNVPMTLLGLPVIVSNGISSSVVAVGSVNVACPIVLGGDQQFLGDNRDVVFSGGIRLDGHDLRINAVGNFGARVLVASEISGPGNVRKLGVGPLLMQGPDNSFTGTLRVEQGLAQFDKPSGHPCVKSRLEIVGPGLVQLLQSDQIFNLCTVSIEAGGQLLLNGNREFLSAEVILGDGAVIDGGGGYALDDGLFLLGTVRARTTNGIATIRNGQVSLNSLVVTFDSEGVNGSFQQTGYLDLRANIIGGAGIGFRKTGGGALRLSGTNSFSGPVQGMNGEIIAAHPGAFGSTISGVELRGSSLTLANVQIGAEPLNVIGGDALLLDSDDAGNTLLGQGMLVRGVSSWAGPITLTTNLIVSGSVLDDMTYTGAISGPGGLSLYFVTNHFAGTTTNTYTGVTYVRCRLLTLNKPAHAQGFAIKGRLSVGGVIELPQVEVRWLNSLQVSPFITLSLHPNALVNLNQSLEGFGTVLFNGGRIDSGPAPGLMEVYQEIISRPTNQTARIEGRMRLLQPRNITVADGPVDPDLQINASILEAAPAGIIKLGPGELMLSAPSSYTGQNQVLAGVLEVYNDAALGGTGAGTTVANGATIEVGLSSALAEPLNIQGTGRGGTNGALYCRFGGSMQSPVTLAAPSVIRCDDTSSGLFLNSTLSGTGPLTKTGLGFVTFSGAANNTYSGETFVNSGRLTLQKPAGVTAIPSHLTIGTGALFNNVLVLQNSSFTIIGAVTVNRGSTWNLNGSAEGWGVADLQGRAPLTLNAGSVQTGSGIFYLPVGGDVVTSSSFNGGASISGNIGLDAGPHRFIVGPGVTAAGRVDLELPAVISQTGAAADILKDGGGILRLAGANSFSGSVVVNSGTMILSNNAALGSTSDVTYVRSNGVLALAGGRSILNETVFFSGNAPGAFTSLGGASVWSGPVFLNTDTRIDVVAGQLTLSGQIGGPAGMLKTGVGTLQLSGASANNYGGITVVNNGLLELLKPGSLAIPGDVILGDAVSAANSAILRAGTGHLPRTANVMVNRSGLLENVGIVQLRTLPGEGRIQLGASTSLLVSNEVDFPFSGVLTGSGTLTKRGPGTMTLRGTSPAYTGVTTVSGGSLTLHGAIAGSQVVVNSGATLRGSGSTGSSTFAGGGQAAPEPASPASLGATLVTPSLHLPASSTLHLDFFGTNDGAGNDTLRVPTGPVTLGGLLSASFRYAPRAGDVITLIDKQSVGGVFGTFSGLSEGAVTNIDSIACRVSYVGGDGNDVTLTVANLPLTYAGGGILSGNGNGSLEPEECVLLPVWLQNRRPFAVTPTNVVLRSLTPGVVVTAAEAAYQPIPPGEVRFSMPFFQLRTTRDFVCGADVLMEMEVTLAGDGTFAIPFYIPGAASTNCATAGGGGCESCNVVRGRFEAGTPVLEPPLHFGGAPSAVLPAKPCPGPDASLPPARYLTHRFTNSSSRDAIVTAQLRVDCPSAPIHALGVAAYLGEFNAKDLCAGYVGDSGQGGPAHPPFSFRVPPGSNLTLVVVAREPDLGCDDYSIELFGLPCPAPTIQIAAPSGAAGLLVKWSTAYPGWRVQAVNSLKGPGPHAFNDVTEIPAVLDGKYTLTNSPSVSRQFFRLAK